MIAGDASLAFAWGLPADADLDHVSVTRIKPGKTVSAVMVYQGTAKAFTESRLKNGTEYRYRIRTHDKTGNASVGIEVVGSPKATLFGPANGATVTAPPTLQWVAKAGATYYNVQLWRVSTSGQAKAAKPVKIMSAWPAKTSYKLRKSWKFEGKTYRLTPGRYTWYVWPGVGKRAANKYGPPMGQSSFTVKAKAAAKKRR